MQDKIDFFIKAWEVYLAYLKGIPLRCFYQFPPGASSSSALFLSDVTSNPVKNTPTKNPIALIETTIRNGDDIGIKTNRKLLHERAIFSNARISEITKKKMVPVRKKIFIFCFVRISSFEGTFHNAFLMTHPWCEYISH